MTALLRYQTALLVRSQRWLAPVLLYAAFIAVGVQWGQPVLDSLGYTAAGLLPVTAWLVQLCAARSRPPPAPSPPRRRDRRGRTWRRCSPGSAAPDCWARPPL